MAYFRGLITALMHHFQRPLILLDGFTYQHNNRDQPQAKRREQACTTRVLEIMESCPQAQLEMLSGLEFAAWLQRTEGLRFYVTHEGTMQHKLGWLQPQIPGLCLVGSPMRKPSPAGIANNAKAQDCSPPCPRISMHRTRQQHPCPRGNSTISHLRL